MFSPHWFYSFEEEFSVVLEKQIELDTIYSTAVLRFSLITNTFYSHCWRLRNDSKEMSEADPLQAVSAHCSVSKMDMWLWVWISFLAKPLFSSKAIWQRTGTLNNNPCCQHHFTPLLFRGMYNVLLLPYLMGVRVVPLQKRGKRNKIVLLLSLGCQRVFWDILWTDSLKGFSEGKKENRSSMKCKD